MSPFESIATAVQSIAQNKVRSFLTMLGVIIGVMSVILLISLGEGAQAYVQREFAGMGSNIILITPGKQETSGIVPMTAGAFRKLTYRDAKELARRARGIKKVAPTVLGAGYVSYGDRRRSTTIVGVTPEFEDVRKIYTQIGRFITDRDVENNTKVCLLGVKVEHDLFGSTNALHKLVSINWSKHLVVGILQEKGMTLGINMDDLVLIPLRSAQQLFYGGEDQLFQILCSARSPEDIPMAMKSIRNILYEAHQYNEDFTVTSQASMLHTFGKIFDALRVMLAGIACISLLVGGIGIMNIMLVSVRERTREVGIRKAVGAKRKDIGLQFLIESVTLSSLGGVTGILLGYAGTIIMTAIYPSLPLGLSAWSVTLSFMFSLTVGVFFGVYPAFKASGVDPVEALRYE